MFYVNLTFLSVQPRRTATQSTLNGSKCHHHSQDNQLTVLTLCVKTKLAQQANGLLPRPHTHTKKCIGKPEKKEDAAGNTSLAQNNLTQNISLTRTNP